MMASDSAAATARRVLTAAFFVAVELAARKVENIAHARAGRCELDCVGVWFQLCRFGFGVVNDEIPGIYAGA
jgi:hypothetical protein